MTVCLSIFQCPLPPLPPIYLMGLPRQNPVLTPLFLWNLLCSTFLRRTNYKLFRERVCEFCSKKKNNSLENQPFPAFIGLDSPYGQLSLMSLGKVVLVYTEGEYWFKKLYLPSQCWAFSGSQDTLLWVKGIYLTKGPRPSQPTCLYSCVRF